MIGSTARRSVLCGELLLVVALLMFAASSRGSAEGNGAAIVVSGAVLGLAAFAVGAALGRRPGTARLVATNCAAISGTWLVGLAIVDLFTLPLDQQGGWLGWGVVVLGVSVFEIATGFAGWGLTRAGTS